MPTDERVEEMAAEVEDTRERIASTIDELQDRLNPKRIVGDAVDGVKDQGMALFGQAKDVVSAHPLAIGAIGAALGLALFARTKLASAKVDLGDDFRGYTDYDDDHGGYGWRSASRYPDEAEYDNGGPALGARATQMVQDNPLASIVIGLAAGALLGALFPETEAEAKLTGALRRR
jgi:ElaB/YqjD/DUF883 family membrane-anchored ribosome-binding protein